MKTIIGFLFTCIIGAHAFAQDCKVLSDELLIDQHKIKTISVRYRSNIPLDERDSLEVAKVAFDEKGRVVYENYFYLFDVVLYSLEFRYTYDTIGRLIEKTHLQHDYPKTKEDSALVGIVGYEPTIKRWSYEYDSVGNLVTEYEYLKATDNNPALSSVYTYDADGNKIKATFKNLRFLDQKSKVNRVEVYEYDKKNRLDKTVMNWSTSDVGYVKTFKYNSDDQVVVESTKHNDGRESNTEYGYSNGKLSSKETFEVGKKGWVTLTTYEYSDTGFLTKELFKRNTGYENKKTFESNEKGLLKREYWYSKKGKKEFYFETTYSYY